MPAAHSGGCAHAAGRESGRVGDALGMLSRSEGGWMIHVDGFTNRIR